MAGRTDAGPVPADGEPESLGVVVIAGLGNLLIAVVKALAGVITGSSAMLSEAVHSLADTTTEVLLFVALRRGSLPADRAHPLGHGPEAWFWAFLASLFTFVAGAGFSITHGLHTVFGDEKDSDFLIAYVVLAFSFLIDGISLLNGVRQVRRKASRWRVGSARYLAQTSDTSVKAVVLEDVAGLIGVLLAAGGLALTEVTGSSDWDGWASVAIGVLLLVVAWNLAHTNKNLLVGAAAPAPVAAAIEDELAAVPGVRQVVSLVTLVVGPARYLVAAKVAFDPAIAAPQVEAACEAAEDNLTKRFPEIQHLYLDPTPGRANRAPASP